MTKTAIKVRELDEEARHNRELEKQGRINTVLSGISNIAGAFLNPASKILSGLKGLRGLSNLTTDEQSKLKDLMARKNSGEKLEGDDWSLFKELLSRAKGSAGSDNASKSRNRRNRGK